MFIKDLIGVYAHRPAPPYSFTIIEPNISFQKSSLIPIMIAESYYRANPDKVHEIAVINGNKLMESPYFKATLLPTLELYKAGKLHMLPRADTRSLAKTLNSNILIQHTVNNEYNYIFLEHLMMGFPVVHNFEKFKEFGYYYTGDSIKEGTEQIHKITTTHHMRVEAYKVAANQLNWNFSISNPDNMKGWSEILDT
jgi:hypothetical protein